MNAARRFRLCQTPCAILFGLSLVVTPVAVATDEDEARSDPLEGVRYYETATVRARPVSDATVSVTILDREEIEDLAVSSVAELMRFVPGVDVATTGPRGGTATAQIRGGDPNYTYVLVDGVPLNDITDQVGGTVNLNSISVAHIERIEFVRGPLSSSFGSTGLAGAINIITRRGESESPEVSFDLTQGSDSVFLGSVGVSQAREGGDYYVGAFWERQEDAIDFVGAEDRYRQVGVQGNTRLSVGDESELRVTGRYTSWSTDDYPDASGGPRLGDGAIRDSEHEEMSLGLEWLLGSGERRHRIHATGYRHELDRESPFIFNPEVPPASVPASIEDTTFTTWQAGWTLPGFDLGRGHLDLGLDVRIEDADTDLDFGPDLSYDIERANGGVFVAWVVESGGLAVEVGTRVDVPEGHDTEVSPRAGVSFRTGATRLRASLGRAFKLPSFFALSVPFFGNPDLDPETVVGADAAVEHTFASAGLFVSLGVFQNQYEDLIDFDAPGMFVNVPEVETRGVELAIDWQAGQRLSVHANATRQHFDDSETGDPLTQRPDWIGGARVTWRVTERARWELDGQWVSEVFDYQLPIGTDLRPGYQLYGSTLTVTMAPGWELHTRVDNLADKEYEPFLGFPGPDRSFLFGVRHSGKGD